MKLKIEACPSCGYEGVGNLLVNGNSYSVKCDMCYAETKPYLNAQEAINAWNGNNANMELLPCPFCGSKDIKLGLTTSGDSYSIRCGGCEVTTTSPEHINRYSAIRFWNTRNK